MIDFEYIPITTMTLIFPLSTILDYKTLFPLLPITYVKEEKIYKKKKVKLPDCKEPGAILTAQYINLFRGFQRGGSKEKHFKNSIMIDICTRVKPINIKLFKNKIQLTGANNIDVALEAVGYIISIINHIQSIITYTNEHEKERDAVISWIKDNCRDGDYIKLPSKLPESKDAKILTFYLRQLGEIPLYDNAVKEIECLKNIKQIYTDPSTPLSFTTVNKAMINYHYNIGSAINRFNFAKIFENDTRFCVRYNNAKDHAVNIDMPYEYDEKKNKSKKHTWMVYQKGAVCQSSPNEKLALYAYNNFKAIVDSHREQIIARNIPIKIKLTPQQRQTPTEDPSKEEVIKKYNSLDAPHCPLYFITEN